MRWPHTICLSSGTRVFVRPDGWLRVGADTSTAVVVPMADRPTAQRVGNNQQNRAGGIPIFRTHPYRRTFAHSFAGHRECPARAE